MDINEFKDILLPIKTKLYRLAKMMLRNNEEAEDILQDVYLKLWVNKEKLSSYNSIEAFAVKITKNLCLDKLKSYKVRDMVDISKMNINANAVSPYKKAEDADHMEIMNKIFNELPDQQRLVILLREVEGHSFEEIEEMTGLSINNIRVALSRARKSAREQFLKMNDHEIK